MRAKTQPQAPPSLPWGVIYIIPQSILLIALPFAAKLRWKGQHECGFTFPPLLSLGDKCSTALLVKTTSPVWHPARSKRFTDGLPVADKRDNDWEYPVERPLLTEPHFRHSQTRLNLVHRIVMSA